MGLRARKRSLLHGMIATVCLAAAVGVGSASADPPPASTPPGLADDDAPKVRVLRRDSPLDADAAEAPAQPTPPSRAIEPPTSTLPPLPTAEELARLDAPYKELLRKFRTPNDPGSLGTTVRGRLFGAAELPHDGAHVAVLPGCRERETSFGTPDLVHLIEDASAKVHRRMGGPRMMVGNLSKRDGGHISWSRSHNSGLDADLAFFVTHDGEPVEAPRLMEFGRHLNDLEEAGYTFDVPRNWQLVRSLIDQPDVEVQWLFVSRPLRRALLRHARELGEPTALIDKASRILWQPMDAKPHNDHFHLRIFCPPRDRVEGCSQTGPVWPWVNMWKLPTLTRAAALAEGLNDRQRETRLAALSKLEDLPGTYASPAIAGAWLHDPSTDVRQKALELLLQWGEDTFGLAFALENYIRAPGAGILTEDPSFSSHPRPWNARPGDLAVPMPVPVEARDGRTVRMAYRLIGMLRLDQAASLLAHALRSGRVIDLGGGSGMAERRMAANASRDVMSLELVDPLLNALEDVDPQLRKDALSALRRILNRADGGDLDERVSPAQRAEVVARWRAFWAEHRHESRDELLRLGFKHAGADIADVRGWAAVEPLVRIVGRKDAAGYNADRLLRAITGQWMPMDATSTDREARWTEYFAAHRSEVRDRLEEDAD